MRIMKYVSSDSKSCTESRKCLHLYNIIVFYILVLLLATEQVFLTVENFYGQIIGGEWFCFVKNQ